MIPQWSSGAEIQTTGRRRPRGTGAGDTAVDPELAGKKISGKTKSLLYRTQQLLDSCEQPADFRRSGPRASRRPAAVATGGTEAAVPHSPVRHRKKKTPDELAELTKRVHRAVAEAAEAAEEEARAAREAAAAAAAQAQAEAQKIDDERKAESDRQAARKATHILAAASRKSPYDTATHPGVAMDMDQFTHVLAEMRPRPNPWTTRRRRHDGALASFGALRAKMSTLNGAAVVQPPPPPPPEFTTEEAGADDTAEGTLITF